jgi:hypothetical protein
MESMKTWLEDNSDVLKSKRLYDEKSELWNYIIIFNEIKIYN